MLDFFSLQSVMECDFLSVAIHAPLTSPMAPLASAPDPVSTQQLTSLVSDSYDVVVFSLLLSFLPHPLQRLHCCVKAHQLLKLHGILLIITPDSSHQNKHATMMKAWKACIEAIGFHRWKYCKNMHLHCMAFRKTLPTRQDYCEFEGSCDLLFIPQDRHCHSKPPPHAPSQSDENLLSHLPFFTDP